MPLDRFLEQDVADASETNFARLLDIETKGIFGFVGKKNPFSYVENKLIFGYDAQVGIDVTGGGRKAFRVPAAVELDESHLDEGSFEVGKDYSVYVVDDGLSGDLAISANASFPVGSGPDESRRIAGFHYGHIRRVNNRWKPVDSEGTVYGSGATPWEQSVVIGIVPNSVWDLAHRPACAPEGMAKIGGRTWVDIYNPSVAEAIAFLGDNNAAHVRAGKLQSVYGAFPATGTEGLTQETFAELADDIGKRLLLRTEWLVAAKGNPPGQNGSNDYGWTKTTNSARARTGAGVNPSTGEYDAGSGIKPFAVSARNIIDCVGNVYEWLVDLIGNADPSHGWHDVYPAGHGEVYLSSSTSLRALRAGGYWTTGSQAGARLVHSYRGPWHVSTVVGARLACDSL